MADISYYVALPFAQDDDGSVIAGTAEEFQSASTAIRRAETLSRSSGAIGAVAFTRSGDPMTGDFKDIGLKDSEVGVAGKMPSIGAKKGPISVTTGE